MRIPDSQTHIIAPEVGQSPEQTAPAQHNHAQQAGTATRNAEFDQRRANSGRQQLSRNMARAPLPLSSEEISTSELGASPKKDKPKHNNPYEIGTEKHTLFEDAWSKKTVMGNFKGLWKSGRQARAMRVQQRVETFSARKDDFVKENGLPLQASYHPERDLPHHPYTGLHGKGEPVIYFDHNTDDRQDFAVQFADGKLIQSGIKNSEGTVNQSEQWGENVMFTRRGSNADQLLAMIKKSKPERVQHSTFNSGKEVANAGFIKLDHDGKVKSFKLSSGHYAPDKRSAVKLAIWSEQHGAFDPGQAVIEDRFGRKIDTSISARLFAVQEWAKKKS